MSRRISIGRHGDRLLLRARAALRVKNYLYKSVSAGRDRRPRVIGGRTSTARLDIGDFQRNRASVFELEAVGNLLALTDFTEVMLHRLKSYLSHFGALTSRDITRILTTD